MAGESPEAELNTVVESWFFIVAIATLALACVATALVPIIITISGQ